MPIYCRYRIWIFSNCLVFFLLQGICLLTRISNNNNRRKRQYHTQTHTYTHTQTSDIHSLIFFLGADVNSRENECRALDSLFTSWSLFLRKQILSQVKSLLHNDRLLTVSLITKSAEGSSLLHCNKFHLWIEILNKIDESFSLPISNKIIVGHAVFGMFFSLRADENSAKWARQILHLRHKTARA